MSRQKIGGLVSWLVSLAWGISACGPATLPVPAAGGGAVKVLATETFLADIAQNVAGDRLKVAALLPIGIDPHSFEPTPQDAAKVADLTPLPPFPDAPTRKTVVRRGAGG